MSEKYKILVADDNVKFANEIKDVLPRLDSQLDVIVRNTIADARNAVDESIDFVLLDVVFDENFPDRSDGLEFLREIRKTYKNLPIVIMSGLFTRLRWEKAYEYEATDVEEKKYLAWHKWHIKIKRYCSEYRKKKNAGINEPPKKDIESLKKEFMIKILILIDETLQKTNGRKAESAEILNISADSMRYWVIEGAKITDLDNFQYIRKFYKKIGKNK
jgi:CheY-like chemotaxis protein